MAQSYTNSSGQTFYVPGFYSSYTVQDNASGTATSGFLAIIGEADQGPSFSQETELKDNWFGPNSLGAVQAKYGSGRIVDAYRNMVAPSGDADIQGAPSRFYVLKTNSGSFASSALLNSASAAYGTLYSRNYGEANNLIYFNIESTDEVKPTTGSFTYIPAVGTVNISVRVNGGTAGAVSLSANTTPTDFVTAIDGTDADCTGGVDRACITVAGTLAVAVSGNIITVTRSVAWAVTPTVGDTLVIPDTSVIEGAANANVGAYVITGVTSTTITATKLSDAGKPGATPGTITAPAVVGAQAIASTTTDLKAYSPVIITQPTTLIEGIGKSIEINELATGTDLLSRAAYVLATTTAVTWISTSATPTQIISATERSVDITVARQSDGSNEDATAGGKIALKVGYTGTTASLQITSTQAIFTRTGGSGADFTVNLSTYATISDLATYISTQTGYTASVGTAILGQQPPTALDEGTYGICTNFGNQVGRIKMDAVAFLNAVNDNFGLVQFGDGTPAAAGLPADYSNTFLAGGTLGATTDALFAAALTALRRIAVNFVIPLFSQDAIGGDIVLDETSSSSTYTIAFINAATKAHCIDMSKIKQQKNRQGFCSFLGSFDDSKDASANMAEARISMAFEDMKGLGANGIVQFQPWMSAGVAAALQAAAFYKPTFNKAINCSGVLSQDGDFDPGDVDQLEEALQAGLLTYKTYDDGSVRIVSDQTTYQRDNNFVWNSFQAIYGADLVTVGGGAQLNNYFTGKSNADFNAQNALSALATIMAEYMRQKLICPSDGAPAGYDNAVVRISGNTMLVTCGIYLSTGIYFGDFSCVVKRVQSSASQ